MAETAPVISTLRWLIAHMPEGELRKVRTQGLALEWSDFLWPDVPVQKRIFPGRLEMRRGDGEWEVYVSQEVVNLINSTAKMMAEVTEQKKKGESE